MFRNLIRRLIGPIIVEEVNAYLQTIDAENESRVLKSTHKEEKLNEYLKGLKVKK